ncbi:DUF1553 domain-containing protein [Aestuariibaculum sediminum]|uniref:DUF1553 domain-containing protein n=1 Tax=Aestuariibaculum sediminum TaxID=2770637 RepID=A0A8J6Q9G8_9FLAO|nr:DUF1553 domain-containing protein [Aestuariibaculum sediminum]MBD0830916.1 DUF1553 domain-containing protein [Aestuariibaculum sediminum]
MKSHYCYFLLILIFFTSCKEDKVNFNASVRPILNKKCISCHGGVKQSGGFGLVFRENALGKTANGKIGILPGHPEKSEMFARIIEKDPELRMPLESDPLSKKEIEIIKKWIQQGAEWEEHWAYLPPKLPEVDQEDMDWGNSAIDYFIFNKMESHDLSPNEEANAYDLVRRLYLDITGIPPTKSQVEAFVSNPSEQAYEALVDTLLQSPKYGEHWASMWLDLARYADSRGYEKDGKREIWKYRDWVIKAFNDDMPFNQFTIEQLAGDLLPNPTEDQYIATAFHRNTLNNSEGGTENEEYRVSSTIDRVNTTWEVWQSTTMSCVQCHSHPYDPIRHEEFYTSYAFFNNTSDWDGPRDYPVYRDFDSLNTEKLEAVKQWISKVSSETEADKWEKFVRIQEPKIRPEDFNQSQNTTHYNRGDQDYMMVYNEASIQLKNVSLSNVDRIYINYNQRNNKTANFIVRQDSLDGAIIGKTVLNKTRGFMNKPVSIKTTAKKADLFFEIDSSSEDYMFYLDGFLLGPKIVDEDQEIVHEIYNKIDTLLNTRYVHSTPVMVDKSGDFSRQTQVFDRGNWLVLGDTVQTDIPKLFNTNQKEFKNRLDLAEWLVSEDNCLTGRVIVNRFWANIFGRGIVLTSEDFGTLGEKPTHPELLDWLALKFTHEWNWSMKTLVKNIVLSATYKQSAVVSNEAKEKDPMNKWLARHPRVRLSAEQIRDQALAVSGLLSDKMYGPSVMPYQPEGIWSVVYNNESWNTSEGEDAYRRGVYTYLRRSSPYPSFISFDASEREFCLSRRINTNSPIQALVTLNDPVYFEAATNLAKQIESMEGDDKKKVETAYQKVVGKPIASEKSKVLLNLLNDTQNYYLEHKEEAYNLVNADNLELASLTVMVNALMNLDEFIVKN